MNKQSGDSVLKAPRLARWALTAALGVGVIAACAWSRPPKPPVPLDTSGSAALQPWQRYADWPRADWKEFSTLRQAASPPVSAIPKVDLPITADAERGKLLAFDRSRGGGCVACHIMGKETPSMPGNVGPDLSEIGKMRSDDWLFGYIYDSRRYNPGSVMPPWGVHGLYNVDEIKAIVAFLRTLQSPQTFADNREDPAKRPLPVETRDNLDPTENPGLFAIDKAETLYRKPGPQGKACINCHAAPLTAFWTWAATMPRFEPRLGKIMGVEEFVTRHARATTGNDWRLQSEENIALSVYLRNFANGATISVDLKSPEAEAALLRGQALMARKIGQLNFACQDCHTPEKAANKWIRGQYLTESRGQLGHFPTWRTSRGEIWDMTKRFQWCGVAIRANELPPDAPEYGDLELALTAMNIGQKISVPGVRH